jgi:hypothetical protein
VLRASVRVCAHCRSRQAAVRGAYGEASDLTPVRARERVCARALCRIRFCRARSLVFRGLSICRIILHPSPDPSLPPSPFISLSPFLSLSPSLSPSPSSCLPGSLAHSLSSLPQTFGPVVRGPVVMSSTRSGTGG